MPLRNLPPGLSRQNIIDAANWIDTNGVPSKRRSEKFVIEINGKQYPPPFLGQVATMLMTGTPVAEQGRLRAGDAMFKVFNDLGFKKLKKGSAGLVIGSIDGIAELDHFKDRQEVMEAGLHRTLQGGIDGNPKIGAGAIVLSGGYEDDFDDGHEIIYTGAGGQENGKQVANQTWDNIGNASLRKSAAEGKPVRVIRGATHRSKFSPKSGYVYSGLYAIEQSWMEKGKSGFDVCRFKLVKCDRQELELPSRIALQPAAEPQYVESTVVRRIRDTELSREIKELYHHSCQVCGVRIEIPGGAYAEGAHIKPLGRPHLGEDTADNLLCMCPNHHAMFDRGGFAIADDLTFIGLDGSLRLHPDHAIDTENLKYHRIMHGFEQRDP